MERRSWRQLDGPRAAWLVGALALLVRVGHLLDLSRLPLFDHPTVDAALYLQSAERIAASGGLAEVFFKPPLFPYVLGFWLRLVGMDFFWLRLPFVVVGAGTAVLTWHVARRLFDARVALLAGLFQALHQSAVYFDGELLEIGLATGIQMAALLALLRAGRRRSALAAGLLVGLGCVARPSFAVFAVVALAWLGRRRLLPAFAGVLLAVAPVTLHNAVHGDFVIVSANLGLNLRIGNSPWANGRIASTPELPAEPARARREATRLAEASAGRALRPSEVSRFWLRRALGHAAAHPGQTAQLTLRKLYYAWHGAPIADNEDLRGLGRYLRLYGLLPVGMWLLAPLGLLGVVAARGTAARELWLLRAYVWSGVLALLPFFVVERFRLPWAPALTIFTAWSLVEIWTRLRQRRPGGLVVVAAVLLVACNLPAFGVGDTPVFDLDYRIAYAYQQQGRIEAAMDAYRAAIERDPKAALARNALGTLLAERGESLDEAAALIEAALRLDPGHAPHFEESLALVELRRGNPQAALAACARGLAASPAPPLQAALRVRRAEALHAAERSPEAAVELRRALELGASPPVAQRARALLARLATEEQTGGTEP